MQPLSTAFEDRLFRYTHVEREGDIAIFCQTHKESGCARFEVVKIRVQPAHTWPNGTTSPEREAYPGSGSWGRWGGRVLPCRRRRSWHARCGLPRMLVDPPSPFPAPRSLSALASGHRYGAPRTPAHAQRAGHPWFIFSATAADTERRGTLCAPRRRFYARYLYSCQRPAAPGPVLS